MSEEEQIEEKPFAIERAKQGRAACKKCKQKCLQGELRIAKLVANPFGDGKMKSWHHISCLFESFLKQRKTTKRIDGPEDIDGWDNLNEDDRNDILKRIDECDSFFNVTKKPKKPIEKPEKKNVSTEEPKNVNQPERHTQLFKEFRKLVADITNTDSYLEKTSCVKKAFNKLFPNDSYKNDIILWSKLLLPGVIKRVYNLQNKQIVKLFSRLFIADLNDMLTHLEQGDIGETVQEFFNTSVSIKPAKKSILTVIEVDEFLNELSKLTKEDEQLNHFKLIVPKCTSNDLKAIIRLIKGDLRMGAGAKHILEGVHEHAYDYYQTSRDLDVVISKCFNSDSNSKENSIILLTPVRPMLAESCNSVEKAMKKCPNGMYSEIKYDGERVQLHKRGSDFKYFSRSLKPVMPHKIHHFKEYIPKAFPHANDMILDCEILLMDTVASKPLPFGSLGKHKKAEFQDATVCLFVFDCIYFNGESLIEKPLSKRKRILRENMTEIPNRIMFSEMQEIYKKEDLTKMIAKVLKMGLEGLVLKDIKSFYEPGKRHWLKVKKDYLFDGAMADSADLLVLGAWYGTGKKGGIMSVFLMGCYNPNNDTFCTVTKVHTGHDDKTLERLQNELDMIKISQEPSKVPKWLKCTKTMIPDFVARDPKNQPVWEVTGAEFTQHDIHTADGISIRFPRVTKIRHDKDWQTATNLQELKLLYSNSKENPDVSILLKGIEDSDRPKRKHEDSEVDSPSPKKKKIAEDFDEEETVGIFSGIKAIVTDELKSKNPDDCISKFIKHDGSIIEEDNRDDATHALHFYNIIREPVLCCPHTVKHVSYNWIIDSLKDGALRDYKMYTVQWNPDI
ncbi:unnamed protein product [Phyllotreta striolata]|uniref:DNA ligase n=1 Tax=Phyllotreta striolata TaxID=444603 RepID=A0A9N9XRW7_PHYSR|nr:unnamed protein product [Phyllotreta striolata]